VTGQQIRTLRERLGFTQVQLAQLLGVHPLTVSRWERDELAPSPHQAALLASFQKARTNQSDVGETVTGLLLTAGVIMALYVLLQAALKED